MKRIDSTPVSRGKELSLLDEVSLKVLGHNAEEVRLEVNETLEKESIEVGEAFERLCSQVEPTFGPIEKKTIDDSFGNPCPVEITHFNIQNVFFCRETRMIGKTKRELFHRVGSVDRPIHTMNEFNHAVEDLQGDFVNRELSEEEIIEKRQSNPADWFEYLYDTASGKPRSGLNRSYSYIMRPSTYKFKEKGVFGKFFMGTESALLRSIDNFRWVCHERVNDETGEVFFRKDIFSTVSYNSEGKASYSFFELPRDLEKLTEMLKKVESKLEGGDNL